MSWTVFCVGLLVGAEQPPAARISLDPGELGNWIVTVEISGQRVSHRVLQLTGQPGQAAVPAR